MARNRIAEAYIDLKARGEQALRSTMGRVRGEAKQTGDSFKSVGDNIDKSTEGVRKLQGAVAGVVGVVSAVVGGFVLLKTAAAALGESLSDGAGKAKKMLDALRGGSTRDVGKELEAIRNRLIEINKELDTGTSSRSPFDLTFWQELADEIVSRPLFKAREEQVRLQKELVRLNQLERAQAARRLKDIDAEEKSNLAQLDAQKDSLRIAILRQRASQSTSESQRVAAEVAAAELSAKVQIDAIERQAADLRRNRKIEEADALESQIELVKELLSVELDGIRQASEERRNAIAKQAEALEQADRDRDNAERERDEQANRDKIARAQEAAQRIAEANTRAFADSARQISAAIDAVLNQQNQVFSRIEDLNAQMVQELQQLKRRSNL